MRIVGYYGSILLVFSVYVTLIISALIWAFIVKRAAHIKNQPLLLELPPYRRPLIENIITKSWIRMKVFVYLVIPLLVIGGVIYAVLEITGLTSAIIKPLSPITQWLGLPAVTIIPLVFGFLQKDLTGAMLLSVLGSNISSVLTSIQIYTFGLAATMQIPCVIALGMLIREFGIKKAVSLTGISIIYGLLFAGLAWRIISIF
jgi:ferrous iron transport protein B